MNVATSQIEVGVRELKNHLSRYLSQVQGGDEVIVTDRGRPVARLSAIDSPTQRLERLIATGAVRPPKARGRRRPSERIRPAAPVSDLVADQRG